MQQRQGDFLSNPSLIPPLRQADLELFCELDKVKLKHGHKSNLQAESLSTKALLRLHRGQKHLEAHCVVGTETGEKLGFCSKRSLFTGVNVMQDRKVFCPGDPLLVHQVVESLCAFLATLSVTPSPHIACASLY